jgi:heme iron utilization protein
MNDTPFDPAALGRRLVRTARDAALGTVAADGAPYVSHVAVATLVDGAPVTAVSTLALHTKNLLADPRASLLFVAAEGETADTATRARVSVSGRLVPVDDAPAARSRLLRRHPDAFYVDFPDFRLLRMEVERAHLVAGFGRIVDLAAADLVAPADVAAAIGARDAGACEHMNEDHADALELIATELGGGPAGPWRAIGIDPQGIDMALGGRVVRVEYDAPVAEGGAMRMGLVALTKRARALAEGRAVEGRAADGAATA